MRAPSARIGIVPWATLAVSVAFFLSGVFLAFPLPLFSAAWGFFGLRHATATAKRILKVYIALNVILAIIMLFFLLVLSPSGTVEVVEHGSTEWYPATENPPSPSIP